MIHIANLRDSTVDHRQGRSQAALFSRLFRAARELLPIFSRMQPAGLVVRMHGTVGPLPAFLGFALILESVFHGARSVFDCPLDQTSLLAAAMVIDPESTGSHRGGVDAREGAVAVDLLGAGAATAGRVATADILWRISCSAACNFAISLAVRSWPAASCSIRSRIVVRVAAKPSVIVLSC